MKNVKNLSGILTLVLLTMFCLSSCDQQPKDVTEQIKQANATFMEAYSNGDAHALAMCYTVDGKVFPANSEAIEGQEAIEAFWNGALGMGIAKADLQTESADAIGNMAVEIGKYKLYAKNGQLIDHGKYMVNWTKVDGKWKLHQDIWNTSIPEPPMKGAWKLVSYKNIANGSVANNFPDGQLEMHQIKIWTSGHFAFSGTYTVNNQLNDNYGGGSYTLKSGNVFSENIEYHSAKQMVGTSVKMLIEVQGNILTQIYPADDQGNYDEDNYSVEKYERLD
ncbi:YybH family protein [Maribellus sediminis]|uniref:YybH family protein n=1 Tax=Maribellus sediminis TaxID=2696285 RepID=UPI00142F8BB7|nr:DUF4440 domain-containing protein [Maribellus sediminis]